MKSVETVSERSVSEETTKVWLKTISQAMVAIRHSTQSSWRSMPPEVREKARLGIFHLADALHNVDAMIERPEAFASEFSQEHLSDVQNLLDRLGYGPGAAHEGWEILNENDVLDPPVARNHYHYFLAPMDGDEMERCFKIIYADRPASSPYRLFAEDLGVALETVTAWGGFVPCPPEVACGLRVRAAIMSGELAPAEETVLSLTNLKIVLRWVLERASKNDALELFGKNDVAELFGELGRRVIEGRQEV